MVSLCRRLICGPNAIDVEITPIWKLLIKEVISPVFCLDIEWNMMNFVWPVGDAACY